MEASIRASTFAYFGAAVVPVPTAKQRQRRHAAVAAQFLLETRYLKRNQNGASAVAGNAGGGSAFYESEDGG